jgi:hypothetical protein
VSARTTTTTTTTTDAGPYVVEHSDLVWLESVYRGFSSVGIDKFIRHSCVPSHHESFCRQPDRKGRERNSQQRKKCIVNYHEVGLVSKFHEYDSVMGLFIKMFGIKEVIKAPSFCVTTNLYRTNLLILTNYLSLMS